MSVIRVNKKKNPGWFTAMNAPFEDARLSWGARGVMAYLLTKPDHWEVKNQDLLNKGPAGEYKLNGILTELKKYGYLEREKRRKPDGTFEWVSNVYEVPKDQWDEEEEPDDHDKPYEWVKKPIPQKSGDGEPTIPRLSMSGSSMDGKPRYVVKTELTNTDSESADADLPFFDKPLSIVEIERIITKGEMTVPELCKQGAMSDQAITTLLKKGTIAIDELPVNYQPSQDGAVQTVEAGQEFDDGNGGKRKRPGWAHAKSDYEKRIMSAIPNKRYWKKAERDALTKWRAIEKGITDDGGRYPKVWIEAVLDWYIEKNRNGSYVPLSGFITAIEDSPEWKHRVVSGDERDRKRPSRPHVSELPKQPPPMTEEMRKQARELMRQLRAEKAEQHE
jgi:hypothetical protein